MVSIIYGAVVLLNEWHQYIGEILVEVETSTHAAKAAHTATLALRLTLGLEQCRVTVRENKDHILGLALGNQVVKDKVHLTHLEIDLLSIGSTAYKVHYGIFLVLVLGIIVERRSINYYRYEHTQSG